MTVETQTVTSPDSYTPEEWDNLNKYYKKQLAERDARIEELEDFVQWVSDWHQAYPTVDAICASMGSQVLKRFSERLEALNRGLSE